MISFLKVFIFGVNVSLRITLSMFCSFFMNCLFSQEVMDVPLLSSVVRAINHPVNDVKCVAALGIHHIASRKLSINEMKVAV